MLKSLFLRGTDNQLVVKYTGQCKEKCNISCLGIYEPICAGPQNRKKSTFQRDFSSTCQLEKYNCGKHSRKCCISWFSLMSPLLVIFMGVFALILLPRAKSTFIRKFVKFSIFSNIGRQLKVKSQGKCKRTSKLELDD